ncbi:putative L,D-transpeptidase YkuD [compost metagenome]
MKNSQHLKAYVQMHPDNKMAWYLLGKEYYKNGQHGKANYCFNQAGEVYEAFEHSKVPAEMLREYEEGLIRENRQRHESRLRLRRGLLALLMLLLLLIPSAVAPGVNPDGSGASDPEIAAGDLEEPAAAEPAEEEEPLVPAVLTFTASGEDAASAGQALAAILKNRKAPSQTAVLAMKKSGRWLIWKKNLPLAATLEQSRKGKIVYQSYDPATCACEPPEAGGLQKQAEIWQEKQEELAALWSAIRSYNSSKGKPPESLKELTRPFPGNVLGETTPLMKQEFAALRAASTLQPLQASAQPSTAPSAEGTAAVGVKDTANLSKGQPPFFSSPLAIIVDKQNHRLAVTSGNIILRNYAVGLGGEKTPEGEFVISDKVVHPNGHDNGEFGSRGMQLSDTNYAIHGTNEPDSIGKDESLGCIRMKREDVEELFAMVPMGTKVQISKGVLPDELMLPGERYPSRTPPDQTNPNKVYHWLN